MEKISKEMYQQGVETLLQVAPLDCSGGRVAVQVLLAAYNSYDYKLDIAELSLLPMRQYCAALAVIRGRVELGIEPQDMVPGGLDRFEALCEIWGRSFLSSDQV